MMKLETCGESPFTKNKDDDKVLGQKAFSLAVAHDGTISLLSLGNL